MLLVLNTIHLVLWGRADALTAVMVGLHLLLGVPVGLALVAFGWAHFAGARDFPNLLRRRTGLAGVALLSVCVASGGALVFTGAFGPGRALLVVHFGTGAAGLGALLLHLAVRLRRDTAPRWPRAWRALAGVVVVALVLGAGGEVWRGRESPPEGEAESFFPTGATTAAGAFIPAEEIMSSASCGAGGCHEDIYEQWSSSQHHYGSFSNPLYRRNVQYVGERLQDVASNFCGGCHDPAPTFSGQMSAFLEPEGSLADAGVSCVGCHSIVETEVIGNGSYVIERPRLYPFAFSADPRLLALNRFLIRVKPGPHRRAFLKDLHRDRSEFCAACHKVHVPKAVNQFRWVRGFDEYDAWQQSGWSGEAAASFYDAEEPKTCQGCHMEETPSDDPVERFLTDPEDPKVTVDVFAAGRGRRFGQADERSGEADAARATAMVAPLGRADFSATPGGWLRLDVVVRNRGVGHNFPAGTTDLWDVWLELRVTDGAGRTVFQSGGLAGGPKGEVDPGAHFFRVLPLDELGRRIDKGNRWDTRTKLYDTTIPAGTADVVHYRFRVPPEVAGPLRVEARLNYRKYRNYFAKWVFGGRPAPGQEELMTATSDPREWILEEAPLPARPIVALARDSVTIPVGDRVTALAGRASLTVPLGRASPTAPAGGASGRRSAAPAPLPEDHLRFNDYGIGLLRQQDLEGALEAFREVVRLDPRYADGYVNLARVHLAAGAFSEAEGALARALELEPGFLKARYFRGLVHFRLGRFEEALSDFQAVLRAFPRDRQVLFQMGRALYVKGDCRSAVPAFHRVLEIDPEDAGAYYNLMLCQRRLGEDQEAAWAEERYETYRLDYDIQQVTGVYRNLHPHESREPEPVHEHRGGRGETPPADGGR